MPCHSRPRFCICNTSAGAWLSSEVHEVFCSQSQVLFEAKCQHSPWPAWEKPGGMGMRVRVNTTSEQRWTEPPLPLNNLSFSLSGNMLVPSHLNISSVSISMPLITWQWVPKLFMQITAMAAAQPNHNSSAALMKVRLKTHSVILTATDTGNLEHHLNSPSK